MRWWWIPIVGALMQGTIVPLLQLSHNVLYQTIEQIVRQIEMAAIKPNRRPSIVAATGQILLALVCNSPVARGCQLD